MKRTRRVIALCVLAAWTAQAQSAATMVKLGRARLGLLPETWRVELVQEGDWPKLTAEWGARTQTAFTVPTEHITYLRQSYVESATPKRLRHSMAHEAGHLACQCDSEAVANQWAVEHE